MDVYANLQKIYGCSLCGAAVKPVKTVIHIKDHAKADLCQKCWNKTKDYPKFVRGIETGEIRVTDF